MRKEGNREGRKEGSKKGKIRGEAPSDTKSKSKNVIAIRPVTGSKLDTSLFPPKR